MNMRKSADWMTIWDDRILEVIREDGSGSPNGSLRTTITSTYLRHRCLSV